MLKVSSGLRRGIEGSEESSKGLKRCRGVQRDVEGFEEMSRGLKRHRRGSKGIRDFERGFEGFEGVSHDTACKGTTLRSSRRLDKAFEDM